MKKIVAINSRHPGLVSWGSFLINAARFILELAGVIEPTR